jgi:hypothetical protein
VHPEVGRAPRGRWTTPGLAHGASLPAVYVSLTRVSTSDRPIDEATIVAQEMERWLRDIDGFEGFLMLSREGTTVGLAFWESREAAERNLALRREFVGRVTSVAGVQIEEIVDYEVAFAHVGALTVGFET